MASLSIPFPDFIAGTTIVSDQVDQNNAAIVNYINARNAASANWDAVRTVGAFTSTLTSNQIILGTTRTVTITAPTPASLSCVWTIPDITSAGTFVALEGAQTFTGVKTFSASPVFSTTVTIPTPFTLGAVSVTATGTEMNFLVGVSSAIQTQLGLKATDSLAAHLAGSEIFTGLKTITIGSTNATTYRPLAFGGTKAIEIERQSTTGITNSAVTIISMNNDTGMVLVTGSDGSNTFIDLILCSSNSSAPTVVSSRSAIGSPAVRTYTASGFAQKVSLASGTYTVTALAIEISI